MLCVLIAAVVIPWQTPPPVVTVPVTPPRVPAPPPKKTTMVVVGANVETASVFKDGVPIHQVPAAIEVQEGKPITIEVRADDYEPEKLVLDGTETSAMIELVPLKGFRPGKDKGTRGAVHDPWSGK